MKKRNRTSLASRLEVQPENLCWECPRRLLRFRSTADIEIATPASAHAVSIVGQRRAIDALRLGMEIDASGYNIFVTGPAGTGRTTTVAQLLEKYRSQPRELDDKCYVNNFKDPDQPHLIRLRPGQGHAFRRDMDELIEYLVKNIPGQFEDERYQRKRNEIVERFKEKGAARVREFEKRVASEGFALVQSAPYAPPELAPIVEKQPVSIESLAALVEEGKLSAEQAEDMKARYRNLAEELSAVFKEIKEQERQARAALAELDRNIVEPLLRERLEEIANRYQARPSSRFDSEKDKLLSQTGAHGKPDGIREYLNEVKESILSRIHLFRDKPRETETTGVDPYLEYRVNVLVDNSETSGAPVVFETNPNYRNLFGGIERTLDRTGQWRSDFTKIKAGSILRADRGFLVLNALDVLAEPGVWPALKRTLRNRRLEIGSFDPFFSLLSTSTLKPERIAIDLKVIIIGDPWVYALLSAYDEEFKKIFKVRADFDWVMNLSDEAIDQYCRVVKSICDSEKLLPFDRTGIARVVEHGVRLAGRQNKISTRFNVISDVLKEASFWASQAGAKSVRAEHVEQAIEAQRDRARLQEEKTQELIDQGTIFIDTTGARVGQINGLAVYDSAAQPVQLLPGEAGDLEHFFGKPTRITARAGVGSAGIINIEREAQLSGPIHDKGVYIIAGFLRSRFAQSQPIIMSASITFEQSYGGIDGDSASSTEIYALLSDLSGLPIRQDLAVTGSVNQHGQIQPIGGVNQKIEGFFATCRARGLTGTQGVIIPKANLPELILRREVVEAVKKGKFHIYAVETVEQGIELLTGVPAGEPDRAGNYPADTVYGRVQKRLTELARIHRDFGNGRENDKKEKKKQPAGLRRNRRR